MLLRLLFSVLLSICYVGTTNASLPEETQRVTQGLLLRDAHDLIEDHDKGPLWAALEIMGDGVKHAIISSLMGAAVSGSLGAISRLNREDAADEAKRAAIYGALHGALEGLIVALIARSGIVSTPASDQALMMHHLNHHIQTNTWHFIGSCLFRYDWDFSSGIKAPLYSICCRMHEACSEKSNKSQPVQDAAVIEN